MNNIPNRESALELLYKFNKSESLRTHALCVEGVMRYFAELNGEDADKWGITGLIHDLDYEMYPEQHCTMTKQILTDENWDEEIIRAVVAHGWGICSDAEPITIMEKTLFAIDELTGLIYACVLVRPSKSIDDLELKSVIKKWKTKTFAAGANRELIIKGAEMLGMELNVLIEHSIAGMKRISKTIGI